MWQHRYLTSGPLTLACRIMLETDQNDDEDYESKYFAALHYVDRSTIETTEDPSTKQPLKGPQRKRQLGRYWKVEDPKPIIKEPASPQPKFQIPPNPLMSEIKVTKPPEPSTDASESVKKNEETNKEPKRPKLKLPNTVLNKKEPKRWKRRRRVLPRVINNAVPNRPFDRRPNHLHEYAPIIPDLRFLPTFAMGYESMLPPYMQSMATNSPNTFQVDVYKNNSLYTSFDNPQNMSRWKSSYDNRGNERPTTAQKPNVDKNENIPNDIPVAPEIPISKNDSSDSQNTDNTPKESSVLNQPPIETDKNIVDKHNNVNIIDLDSSDDDSVIEIPNIHDQSIHIESSDDENEIQGISAIPEPVVEEPSETQITKDTPDVINTHKKKNNCVSPVPSIMSSTSDDFIQQDCRRLELLKDYNSSFEFNFDLHGADLCKSSKSDKETPLKKSQNSPSSQLKNSNEKESISCSTPKVSNDIFATPKSKKPKSSPQNKSYTIPDASLPATYIDIYDSESSDFPESVVDVPINVNTSSIKNKKYESPQPVNDKNKSLSDDGNLFIHISNSDTTVSKKCEKTPSNNFEVNDDTVAYVKKVIDPTTKEEKTTLEKCIKNMKAFYDDSWGGEDFDHIKIKQQISGAKELWQIDLADKLCDLKQRKRNISKCQECNRCGHREDRCPLRPKRCYMCGQKGHFEQKCLNKICLNCGKPNNSYTTKCRNCVFWRKIKCKICHLHGHPKENCPDIWRRYHLTIKNEIPLVEDGAVKPTSNMYCSGCGKKGHLQFDCKASNSKYSNTFPFICDYTPIYVPDGIRNVQNHNETSPLKENSSHNSTKEIIGSSKNDKSKVNKQSDIQKSFSKENVSIDDKLKSNNPDCIGEASYVNDTASTSNDHSKLKRRLDVTHEKNNAKKTKFNTSKQLSELIDMETTPDITESENNIGNPEFTGSRLYLSRKNYRKLNSVQGKLFLRKLSSSLNVHYKFFTTAVGPALVIPDNDLNKTIFLNNLSNYLYCNKIGNGTIPPNKLDAIKKLKRELDSLKEYIGNPSEIFNGIKVHELELLNHQRRTENERLILSCIDKIYAGYKKLNMILIGQAGLEGGNRYVTKLYNGLNSMQTKKSKKGDNLSFKQRESLGQIHFAIFSNYPLHNYAKLIEKYMKTLPIAQPKKNKA